MKKRRKKNPRVEYHADGSRSIQLTPDEMLMVEAQFAAFRQKFGREPGPDDPLLFDPNADEPRPIDEETLRLGMAADMKATGADPAYIHAFVQTGMFLTEENEDLFSEEDLARFDAAVDDYEQRQQQEGEQ